MSTSGNPETSISFRRRTWEFWRRNNIILLQFPIMLVWLFVSYVVLKAIDPRIGVTGFGDIFGYALNSIRICFIIFTSFWVKKWMLFDLHDRTELELFNKMRDGDRAAYWIVVRDRVEWAVLLFFATWWYTR